MALDYVLRKSLDLNNNNGFQLHLRRSSRNPAVHLTDAEFTDDLALIANFLESVANCVGLFLDDTKTEYMSYTRTQSSTDNLVIKTVSGHILKHVEDYKYLGSFASSSEKDFNSRKGHDMVRM